MKNFSELWQQQSNKAPERRQSTRIVTLKNAAWVFGVILALLVVVSAWNERRYRSPEARGRLQRSREAPAAPVARPMEVVEEPVSSDSATPRPVYLRDGRPLELDTPAPTPPAQTPYRPSVAAPEPKAGPTLKETKKRGGRTVITGGADGVRVDVEPATTTRPELTTTQPPNPPDREFQH